MARTDPSRTVRLPQELHDWSSKTAKTDGRSINSYFVQLVKIDKETRETNHANHA
jgi:predicted HicB family RNase H-like nuclease